MGLLDDLANIDDRVEEKLITDREEALLALSSAVSTAGVGMAMAGHAPGDSLVVKYAQQKAATDQLLGHPGHLDHYHGDSVAINQANVHAANKYLLGG